jgi:CheY-like chemotaxis protein
VGFAVVTCATGGEAPEYLRGHHSGTAAVDLRMPDVGGIDVKMSAARILGIGRRRPTGGSSVTASGRSSVVNGGKTESNTASKDGS